ncbi:MAG: hypothetical protein AAF581_17425 [Planctomycetota bacterium]
MSQRTQLQRRSTLYSVSLALFVLPLLSATLFGAEHLVVNFDNIGAEEGITVPGAAEFEIFDTKWQGGVVTTALAGEAIASGSAAWLVGPGGGQITLGAPVVSVQLFYVHGPTEQRGTAQLLDADGNLVGTLQSRPETVAGDPGNYVDIELDRPASLITFSSGVVDAVTLKFVPTAAPQPEFVRGDCNGDGTTDIADVVRLLVDLFVTPTPRTCADACDHNDDGTLNIGDAVTALEMLFGSAGPLPGGSSCNTDITPGDPLDCGGYAHCP